MTPSVGLDVCRTKIELWDRLRCPDHSLDCLDSKDDLTDSLVVRCSTA